MAFLRVIPSRKTFEVLCFLVLTLAQTGHFVGNVSPPESSCTIPPLNCRQIQNIQDAIADGTMDRIETALEADGAIFVGNSSFPPIVKLTEEQTCAIERCFGGFDPVTPGDGTARRKRGVENTNLACRGNVGAVLYTVNERGECAQVVVNDLPSATGCTQPAAHSSCTGCCCRQTFRVKSIGIVMCGSITSDYFVGDFRIEHCTCCNT